MATTFHFRECPMSRACRGEGEWTITIHGLSESGAILADWPDVGEHTWTDEWRQECSACGDDCLCDVYERGLLDVQDIIKTRVDLPTRRHREAAYRIYQAIQDELAPYNRFMDHKSAVMASRRAAVTS